jgi:hypothetical protein
MHEKELDERIRRQFAAAAEGHPAPDFEAMLEQASRSGFHAPAYDRWRVVAAGLLAALLVAAVGLELRPAATVDGDASLVAELSATTYWTAPSDRWLGATPRVDYLGLPRFEQLEEVPKWF